MRRNLLILLLLAGCRSASDGQEPPPGGTGVRLVEVASGFSSPIYLTAPAGDDRLFVVEQPGRIRIVEDGQVRAAPFLDIDAKVSSGGERGLLSVAFHPNYQQNGFFYVNYTDNNGDTRVERYRVSADRYVADPASASLVIAIDQPYSNHNGGLVMFGPDGKLYVGMGDGGAGGDPHGHGQNVATLLGDILRLDVDAGQPYAVPPDNPFVGRTDARPEIWATGVRNPWRFSFDRQAGLLYLADVGQNAWEEINVVPAGQAGANYGWNIMESRHCYRATSCSQQGLVIPVLEYNHSDGCSVTGGYVYRGTQVPDARGLYFYADYCNGWVRSFRYAGGQATDAREWDFGDLGSVSSFGEDGHGELYVVSHDGRIWKFAPGE